MSDFLCRDSLELPRYVTSRGGSNLRELCLQEFVATNEKMKAKVNILVHQHVLFALPLCG